MAEFLTAFQHHINYTSPPASCGAADAAPTRRACRGRWPGPVQAKRLLRLRRTSFGGSGADYRQRPLHIYLGARRRATCRTTATMLRFIELSARPIFIIPLLLLLPPTVLVEPVLGANAEVTLLTMLMEVVVLMFIMKNSGVMQSLARRCGDPLREPRPRSAMTQFGGRQNSTSPGTNIDRRVALGLALPVRPICRSCCPRPPFGRRRCLARAGRNRLILGPAAKFVILRLESVTSLEKVML